ncbi:MAG: tRNA pseudouridine(55) synthase TruB [Acidobacteriota bacterium]|nr:tRNA pseudouridine(55) synthase TruB [Acidobacteriota bacterium]
MTADGILIVDKPMDWTSHDVVAKVRKILRTRRVGHTGTLDPFATGVLVICLNRATRLVQFLTGDDKEYVATMRLGFATDTGDLTGKPLSAATDAGHISREQVQTALAQFRGRIQQIPPMYSAKKVGGVRLHEMARRGEEIERQPIEIEIKEIELPDAPGLTSSADSEIVTRDFSFRVVCSSGSYIRTLAEDIGKQLGLGAHLIALRRTRAGDCRLAQAVTLEHLAELAEAGRTDGVLISMTDAIGLPEIELDDEERKAVTHGRSIRCNGSWQDGAQAKLCDSDQRLVAIAGYDIRLSVWRPRVVLAEAG